MMRCNKSCNQNFLAKSVTFFNRLHREVIALTRSQGREINHHANARRKLKNILLGLLPLVVFWLVEDHWGTVAGLLAAMVWGVGEVLYEKIFLKEIQSITWISTLLVLVFGALGLLLDNSSIFKFQPVILEAGTVVLLIGTMFQQEPFMLKMAQKAYPDKFIPGTHAFEIQKILIKRTTWLLVVSLVAHCIVMAYAALYMDTGTWIFWKSIGLFVIVVPFFGAYYLWLYMQGRKKR